MTPIPEVTSKVPLPTDMSSHNFPNSKGGGGDPVQDPLPKYSSYEAHHPGPTAVQEYNYTAHVQRRQSSPMRRFCTAFAFAILAWVLISALVQSMMVITHYGTQFASTVSCASLRIVLHSRRMTLSRTNGPATKSFRSPPTWSVSDAHGAMRSRDTPSSGLR